MKKLLLLLSLIHLPSLLHAAIATPIYAVLGDEYSSGDDVYTWGNVTVTTPTAPAPPEGYKSLKAVVVSGFNPSQGAVIEWGGWGVVNLTPGPTPTRRSVDMSAYQTDGEMRFWINCSTDNFEVAMEHNDNGSLPGTKESWLFHNVDGWVNNTWLPVIILMSDTQWPLNDIFSPFEITLKSPGTCYVDHVRYVLPPTFLGDVFDVSIRISRTKRLSRR